MPVSMPMAKSRKAPERTCIACRSGSDKQDLLRVTRTPEGEIRLDPTGKAPGRGAYVCRKAECVAAALKQNRFDRALRAKTPATLAKELSEVIEQSQEKT